MPTKLEVLAAGVEFYLAADPNRTTITIQNQDAANPLYVSDQSQIYGGIIVIAGATLILSNQDGDDTQIGWTLYSPLGVSVVAILEGYGRAVTTQMVGTALPVRSPLQEPDP